LEEIRDRGQLKVLTRNGPTTFYLGPRGRQGIEYDLAQRFADHLGVELVLKTRPGVKGVLDALAKGKGDLAAAGIARTPRRAERFRFAPGYLTIREQVVCWPGKPPPQGVSDLIGRELVVASGSSYVQRLRRLKTRHPRLTWQATDQASTEQLLAQVAEGRVDCTVADSHLLAINRRLFPSLAPAFALSEGRELAWAMPAQSAGLQQAVREWMAQLRREHALGALRDRYFGHIREGDFVNLRVFRQRINERLPRYRDLFKEAADRYGLDWRLLAAQAYQESHWEPDARSHTGVRGMMMLTRITAGEMGIGDRTQVAASVQGGARYLAQLRDQLPPAIDEPDRTWIALAAYNVGLGHIWDARRLARDFGRDPNHWAALKDLLPLLSQKRYYRNLPYGYARGTEPVEYVRRIRQYLDVLHSQT
jgi:membrane-bound lytic murein transglycosylase F